MNHLIMTLPFILFAGMILLILMNTDPRRQQAARKFAPKSSTRLTLSSAIRKGLALSLLLPFIPLALMNNYAGILMYAGALTVIGWLIAELPSKAS